MPFFFGNVRKNLKRNICTLIRIDCDTFVRVNFNWIIFSKFFSNCLSLQGLNFLISKKYLPFFIKKMLFSYINLFLFKWNSVLCTFFFSLMYFRCYHFLKFKFLIHLNTILQFVYSYSKICSFDLDDTLFSPRYNMIPTCFFDVPKMSFKSLLVAVHDDRH